MQWIVVVEYDEVDVRAIGDQGPRFVPGEPSTARVVFAKNEDEAIREVAERPGYYSAQVFDPSSPRRFTLVEHV